MADEAGNRDAGRRMLLVRGGGVQGRHRRAVGGKRLYRRPDRQSDLQAGLRRRYRPCRGDPYHLRCRNYRYGDLLDIFFHTHDPTTLNRQGGDIGTQYRSAIFPHSPEQEAAARAAITRAQPDFDRPIVTTIEPLGDWYPAEDYHQDYWANGGGTRNPYCLALIPPKLRKLRKSFADRVKEPVAAS